ncbi:hypothetical protein [Spirillospora sp. CA-294931]|uniref:hypothetical protein n=1 Tax=Spirillospora sp. CA-294931 TaxID=3240042 RepID=UPI003D90347A
MEPETLDLRLHRNGRILAGIVLPLFIVVTSVAFVIDGLRDADQAAGSVLGILAFPFGVALGVRARRLGVQARPGVIIVHNVFQTVRVPTAGVIGISVAESQIRWQRPDGRTVQTRMSSFQQLSTSVVPSDYSRDRVVELRDWWLATRPAAGA